MRRDPFADFDEVPIAELEQEEKTNPRLRIALDRRMKPIRKLSIATISGVFSILVILVGVVSWGALAGRDAVAARESTLAHIAKLAELEARLNVLEKTVERLLERKNP